ncbi:acyl-CoA dehydrogenase [Flexithrix dorotheae]|uniref:acyl-CoA dehydrogenase n=1 Tax=Flexithrix dorotheae TaxID=70993 RepID=UPI0003725303|nr:acyl-CoA dehydrogenase [Flexithrix dorotheae]
MAHQYINMETLRFQLYVVHKFEELLSEERYNAYDKASIDLLLDAVKTFSDKDLFPYIKEMDEKPAIFENGKIIIHPQFKQIFKQAGEMDLIGGAFNEEDGGLQLPATIFHALNYIMEAANNHVPGYLGLTSGAANLILSFGNEALKKKYVPKMLEMKWGGTMCLTEPQAGSSLSDIKTTAQKTEKGHYRINGQKIFISSGDHQFAENIVHLLLARIEGAPAGTKGVSLFVVPKYRIDESGALATNHVTTAGEFEKMGQRGYCTTHLVFGDNGECQGWLVGEENKGLSYMFQMMNEARIGTGRMGAAIASAAYFASLQYARERPQGRKLTASGKKDAESGQTLIINHPDVQRMLLLQKSIVEGALSLILQASMYFDRELTSEGEEKEKYNLLLELLTPVVKTYPAEMGRVSVSNGLQVLGGYGYCQDFILQQYYRDIRIIAIYEGTTGIQSIDLLGRKVGLKKGLALELLSREIQQDIKRANEYEELNSYANTLLENLGLVQKVLASLMPHAESGNYEKYLADATVFMEMFGTIIVGWQWLKMAVEAKKAIETEDREFSKTFYESKIHTMKFYYKYEMSKTKGLAKILMDDNELTVSTNQEIFD